MKLTYLAIIVFSLSVSLVGTSSVFAPCPIGVTECGPPPGVTVGTGTDSQSYEKNDTITIQGRVYVPNYANPVPIQIVNPNGTTIQRINVIVTNSTFSTQMQANFDTSGLYHTVTCVQSWCDRTYFKYIAEPYKITANGQDYFIWYKTVADLQGIEEDIANNTLLVHIANGSGNITLTLPRNLIDSKMGNSDSKFNVLVGMHQPDKYMQPANYTEIKTTDLSRTIQIQIPHDDIADMNGIWDFKITSNTRQEVSSLNTTVNYGSKLDKSNNQSHNVIENQLPIDNHFKSTWNSPLKQFKSGITTQNITCKEGFVIAIKKEGHQPACVNPDTIPKLVLRGWSENPLNSLLLKYGNQTQANLVFYDIMNEPKIRDWSMKGWRYSDYSYASNGETHQSSATIHLFLPSNIGTHECENGSYGIVVINLNPVEIEHNYTEVACEIITTTASVDPESNGK